ncbi:GNAT family N-acetyltransferase [Paenibacillus sp. P96]|uniref:GNAT family N-acetyltransferase n=1 Tax=Paenibacillus zeirhizosphaerae TaxID=2987519 RepID=A0ABT9FU51_9BACL|nr:GNAT family N-acetyltransferase [Paenibacillus sp. P96]MDP4098150.1 GNAT family N-acetyltransferase [Paenibacillus sp. P96]
MTEIIMVKEYSSGHQPQIVDLILNIQQNEYQIPITGEDQPDLLNVEDFYQKGAGNFWVALHGDKVVGTVALLDIHNRQTALRKMFVAQEYRGKVFGTASLLLNNAKAWAEAKSVDEIYLGTTLQFVAAHRFYEKNGFQEIPVDALPENFPVMQVDKKFYKYNVIG